MKGTVTESAAKFAVAAVEAVMEHSPGEVVVKLRTTGADDEFNEQPAVLPVAAMAYETGPSEFVAGALVMVVPDWAVARVVGVGAHDRAGMASGLTVNVTWVEAAE